MKRQVIALLKRARRFLDEHEWTQGVLARNAAGAGVDWKSKTAVAFCAHGALLKVRHQRDYAIYSEALGALDRQCRGNTTEFNDRPGRRKSTVLRVFDKTIETLSRKTS